MFCKVLLLVAGYYVVNADLELTSWSRTNNLPDSVSQVLELKVCATTPNLQPTFFDC